MGDGKERNPWAGLQPQHAIQESGGLALAATLQPNRRVTGVCVCAFSKVGQISQTIAEAVREVAKGNRPLLDAWPGLCLR